MDDMTTSISVGYKEREYLAVFSSAISEGYNFEIRKSKDPERIWVQFYKSVEYSSMLSGFAYHAGLAMTPEVAKCLGEQLLVAGQSNIEEYSSTFNVVKKKIKKIK